MGDTPSGVGSTLPLLYICIFPFHYSLSQAFSCMGQVDRSFTSPVSMLLYGKDFSHVRGMVWSLLGLCLCLIQFSHWEALFRLGQGHAPHPTNKNSNSFLKLPASLLSCLYLLSPPIYLSSFSGGYHLNLEQARTGTRLPAPLP